MPNELTSRFNYSDDDGRRWAAYSLMSKGSREGLDYSVKTTSGKVVKPHEGSHWSYSEDSLQQLIKENRIWFGQHGNRIPCLKKYLDQIDHKKPEQ